MDELEIVILMPALVAGLLVLVTHVPLGIQVLARGIVFIDLAIAQVAGAGVIMADALGWEPRGWAVQVAALSAALAAAALLVFTERFWPTVQEATIGVLFILASTGSILLLAHNPHGSEHLADLLVGQILWITRAQLSYTLIVTAAILALWFRFEKKLGRLGFYLVFAFAVTTSVQLVGVYLVFASLIVPALSVRNYAQSLQIGVGYLVGLCAYTVGLVASAALDLPSGPVVVWAMVAVALLVYTLGPKKVTA
jgi:zinc/manganese transport system permease protein